MYEHARKGEVVERQPSKITISQLEILETATAAETETSVHIRVVCSAGTYVRTLAEDIGRVVGIGAHLTELRRTRAGRFDIADAVTLEQLALLDDPASRLLPMTAAVEHLPELILTADRMDKTMNGLSTRVEADAFTASEPVRMIDADGKLIAIGFFVSGENIVQPKVVLV